MKVSDCWPGRPVKRIWGRNKGRKGVIVKVFSTSGTIHVRYGKGSFGCFCQMDDFVPVGEAKPKKKRKRSVNMWSTYRAPSGRTDGRGGGWPHEGYFN